MHVGSKYTRPIAILLLASVPALSQSVPPSVAESIREPMRPAAVTGQSATARRYEAVETPRTQVKRSGPSSKLLLILGAGAAATIVGILSVKSGGAAATSAPPAVTAPPTISIGNISIGGPRQ